MDYSKYIDNRNYDYQLGRDAVTDADVSKKYAYDTAMSMLSLGVTPSAEMLKEAGISSTDAQAIANKVLANEKKKISSSSGDGYTPTPKGDPDPEPQLEYKETTAVNSFIARIRTKHEFARGSNTDKTTYGTYANYVDAMIEKYSGNLTDNDVYTIAIKLGIS
jgi:hypothetical protein